MHFAKADEVMDRNPRRVVRAPRIMSKYYRAILDLLMARGFAAPREPVRVTKLAKHRHSSPLRVHLMPKTVHIIGAGHFRASRRPSGSANANCRVHVHEATQQAGGRCRSYFDAATNLTIDNGNHLLLSGQPPRAAPMPARSAPRRDWSGRERAQFPFVDLCDRASAGSSISATAGCRPGCSTRRAACPTPACSIISHLTPLIWAGAGKLVGNAIPCDGTLYQRLVQPLLLAALNCRSARRLGRRLPARSCAKRCWRADRPAGR